MTIATQQPDDVTTLDEAADPPATEGGHHDGQPEPWFARLARFSATHRRWVMIVWLVATLAAAPLALTLTGALSGAGWEAQGSTSVEVRDELRRDFPELGAEAAIVVYRQAGPIADDPAGVQALVADLEGAPGADAGRRPALPAARGRPDLARRSHGTDPGRARRRPTTPSCRSRPGELIDHVDGCRSPRGRHASRSPVSGRSGATSTTPTRRRCTRPSCSRPSRR